MKKFKIIATSTMRLGMGSEFHIRAWDEKDAKKKARDQGRCLATDHLTAIELTECGYEDCDNYIVPKYGKPGVAMSRHDNKTLICSDCGRREALESLPKSLLRTNLR